MKSTGFRKRLKLWAAMFIILFSISSASILVLLSGASAPVCAFWRLTISFTILAAAYYVTGKTSFTRFISGGNMLLTAFSGFLLGVHFLLWMESLFHVPVSISTTVVVSYPLFNLVVDVLVFHERIDVVQAVGLLTGFTCILLFMHPSVLGNYSVYGVLFSLGGALAASGYFSIGRYLRKRIGLMEYVLPTYGFASLTLLSYSLLVGVDLVSYPPKTYLYLVLLALLPMICGHTLMNYLLKYMKSSVVTSIALGEPVGASILAYFILGQVVDVSEVILMALVLSSILLTVSREKVP